MNDAGADAFVAMPDAFVPPLDSGPPPSRHYTSCFNSTECGAGLACFYVDIPAADSLGKMCTSQCTSAAMCPGRAGFAGTCYSLPPDMTQLCYQRCAITADCAANTKCLTVTVTTGVMDAICVPNNRATP